MPESTNSAIQWQLPGQMTEEEAKLFTVVDNSVGYLYLNRPCVHNAIDKQMWDQLPGELARLKDGGVKVAVIAGKGDSFAAGADLDELMQLSDYQSAKDNWRSIANSLNQIARFPLPTIAMINGACLGGGLLLALACDLRYSADDAKFALPIARLGIVLDDENIERLVSLVGVMHAKELIYLARTISAQKAEKIGLINDAIHPEQLEAAVAEIAREIAHNAHNSIEEAKLSIKRLTQVKTQNEETVVESYLGPEFKTRTAMRLKFWTT